MPITLCSKITVEEIQAVGSDDIIVHAARVSTRRYAQLTYMDPDGACGLIRYLMRSRHGSPFEHGSLTVRVHAPIKVWREWMRHRIGWSYNETSGRYQQLEPVFWIPPPERPMLRPEGFRSANPSFELASEEEYEQIVATLTRGYEESYARYEELLALGVDRGLARDVLGVGIFSSCYCTANPRSIMAFLELRTNHPEAKRPSKPLWEIANAAEQLEALFASHWPITHAAFCEFGRMAP